MHAITDYDLHLSNAQDSLLLSLVISLTSANKKEEGGN